MWWIVLVIAATQYGAACAHLCVILTMWTEVGKSPPTESVNHLYGAHCERCPALGLKGPELAESGAE